MTLLQRTVEFNETGSLARAAGHAGRSESAVRLQMKRLEELLDQRVLTKLGRRLVLREEG
jgi:DNA-binding transcriptional LysR family regulator